MKAMLDSMVNRYVPDPVVFGVLVEGYTMRAYKMDLEYDGVYTDLLICVLVEGSLQLFKSDRVKNEASILRKKWSRPTALYPTSSSIQFAGE
ncbi:hypothetical protein BDC45DRAFT_564017 [Circinella umbellata]|nr:hypothetical protein BDC45DRAFT_564017 [Circinella umbellata]